MHAATTTRSRATVVLAAVAMVVALFVTAPTADAAAPQDRDLTTAAGADVGAAAGNPTITPIYSGEYVLRDRSYSNAYALVTGDWCLVDEFCLFQRQPNGLYSVWSLKNCNQRSLSDFLDTSRTAYNHQTRIPATARLKNVNGTTYKTWAPGETSTANWYDGWYLDIC
ncbi:hypothetical protein GCM10028784_26270 [Myceligenerans cantabricum]